MEAWGKHCLIELHFCAPQSIRDAAYIKRFVVELCELIDMKRFGESVVVHFGEDEKVAGFSCYQLIETSCVSAHFANASNRVFLDVFSCKDYDSDVVVNYAKAAFGALHASVQVVMRD